MPISFQKQMCTFTVQPSIFVIHLFITLVVQEWSLGFPDDSVLKNPPANAGDTGLIPDLGRSHMKELLHPSATTIEPVLQSLEAPTTEPMCSNY